MLSYIFAISVIYHTVITAYAAQEEQQKQYSFQLKWGSKGNGDGQFLRPHDIEFDSLGYVYIGDRDNNDIQKFTHDGKFVMQWGAKGSGEGEFDVPYSTFIDQFDNVYVVDRGNERIQKFTNNGTFIAEYSSIEGSSSDKTFGSPEDMARNPSTWEIYIADTGNNRIIKFDKDFNYILEWGSEGSGEGEFDHPHGIGVDSHGNVYVNELNNARIQKFDGNGNFIKQWGSEGTDDGQFTLGLEHLFVDSWVNVWQVDGADNPRIQKFDSNGTFITSVGSGPCEIEEEVKTDPIKMAGPLECDGELHKPEHANIDSSGNLYVVDRGNQRMVVYVPVK